MLLYRSAVMLLFQSTLPREERLFRQLTITDRRKIISIHAPTRGATYLELANEILGVFQSTLPREERRLSIKISHLSFGFQSTLPREERLAVAAAIIPMTADFNPRSHERSDERLGRNYHSIRYFNPRSHERSDI